MTVEERKVVFLDEIKEVCKYWDMSISHQDGHGAFILEPYNESNIDWLKYAQVEIYD